MEHSHNHFREKVVRAGRVARLRRRRAERLPRLLQGLAGTAAIVAYLWLAAPPGSIF